MDKTDNGPHPCHPWDVHIVVYIWTFQMDILQPTEVYPNLTNQIWHPMQVLSHNMHYPQNPLHPPNPVLLLQQMAQLCLKKQNIQILSKGETSGPTSLDITFHICHIVSNHLQTLTRPPIHSLRPVTLFAAIILLQWPILHHLRLLYKFLVGMTSYWHILHITNIDASDYAASDDFFGQILANKLWLKK